MLKAIERTTLNLKETARYIGSNEHAIRTMVNNGTIPFIRVGKRRIIFPKAALDKWLMEKSKTKEA
jgi:excisionase family DNA binding protein